MASSGEKREKNNQSGDQKRKKRKESILDLSKYLEKTIRVKFAGGREASGVLKRLRSTFKFGTRQHIRISARP
ncbi:hypothetical protein NQ314_007824 [Rhamnusium bicolor]|uniref:Uncharacterized protein n=1 Tax=Rhamnusium bicolor TaxID=1586634 RepID=A0AAV8YHM1_9CUCU|nr:hypothetical protein NQ314_007824 [Rhamnusium bicolor]